MFYEGYEDILTVEEIAELAEHGFHPGQPYEPEVERRSITPYELDGVTLTAEELAQIDAIADSDDNTPPRTPPFGPLTLAETFREVTKTRVGFYPHPWQVDIAVALYEGSRDVLLIAGTGYGKTLPLVMNNFLDARLITWIVSPLNYIEIEQARVFSEDWKLNAVAVNSMTSRPGLIEDIKRGAYQVVISSIESMTAVNKLRPALASALIANRRQILVIDEAHCVSSWSESDFRPLYATVGQLRRILPIGTPVVAATATANKLIRTSIQNVLAFRPNPYIVNKGNFRANLIHIVHRLKGSESALNEILDYFHSKTDLPLALVFVNSHSMGRKVLKALTDYVDPSMRGTIHLYHAHLDNFHKKVLTDGFRSGKFRVLVCTESLTMGADFRKVSLVINFMATSTLLTWLQRAGRGAWDPSVTCRTVLMVQPSLFDNAGTIVEEVAGVEEDIVVKEEEDDETLMIEVPPELVHNSPEVDTEEFDDSNPAAGNQGKGRNGKRITYSKAILGYIRTTGCRNAFLDREYDNPVRLDPCTTCDNCINVVAPEISLPPSESSPDASQAPEAQTAKLVWLRPAERKPREDKLREWRREKWNSPECTKMNITEAYILSDKAITAFARHPNITSVLDLKTTTTVWPHHERWGQEIVDILWDEQREREEERNQSARLKEVRKAQQAQEKAERERKKQEAKRERMAAGPSSQKRPKRERAPIGDLGRGGSSMCVERRIKQELIDEVLPMESNDGSGVVLNSSSNRQEKGKNRASVPLTQSQQLELLAIRLPKPKKPRLDPS